MMDGRKRSTGWRMRKRRRRDRMEKRKRETGWR